MGKTEELGTDSGVKERCATDKDLLKWAADLFTDLGDTLRDAAESDKTFSRACKEHGFSWSSVRRLLTLETLKDCRPAGPAMTLAEVTQATPDPCSELYVAVFGKGPARDADLPPDYEASIETVLGKMTEREASVIRMRYGIGMVPLTLAETAETFHVTRERIRQIEAKAITKLGRYPYREILRRGISQFEADQKQKKAEREREMALAEDRRQEALAEYERVQKEAEEAVKKQQDDLWDELNIPIECLNLSPRPYNCLKREGITTVGELLTKTDEELRAIRNMGNKSVDEIRIRCKQAMKQAAGVGRG